MAGLGFKDFQVGEVLTSADVDGYLMQQTVMRFADAGARGSALGTATGTAVPLAEGMVSYLDDANRIEVYNGTAWTGVSGFTASTTITATDASWTVPVLASPIVRVTVIGGGGGGGSWASTGSGGTGGTTTFGSGAAYEVSAAGGTGGDQNGDNFGQAGTLGLAAGNGAQGAGSGNAGGVGQGGNGGSIKVAYIDLTGVSTVNVQIGAGGARPGSNYGGLGGRGEVIVEYVAG